MWAKKDRVILCRYCKQQFTPTAAQLKCWDYRCQPCRYKYVQKPYDDRHPGYSKEWKRKNRTSINLKRKPTYKAEWIKHRDAILEKRAQMTALIQREKNKPCMDCGKQYPPFVMHFDHRDPSTKIRNVSGMATYTEERIRAEIAKCDVVCANCHALRTVKSIEQGQIKLFGRTICSTAK